MSIKFGHYLYFFNGMKINKFYKYLIILIIILSSYSFLKFNEVSKKLTKDDIFYIELLLDDFGINKNTDIKKLNFDEKIYFIKSIQKKIIGPKYINKPIAQYKEREPKDYYNFRPSSCFDNSRIMQKILNYFKIDTIQVAIYVKKSTYAWFQIFLKPKLASHSVTIAIIDNKNILIDSTENFISIKNNNNIIHIKDLDEYYNSNWKFEKAHPLFSNKFIYVYGLYSRHGKFYKPYFYFPDINFSEFKFNFINF